MCDGGTLGDAEVAALASALTDVAVRDTLYALAVGAAAGQAETLWALLARTLPEPWRLEALVLLAFSAYARGDGPLAGLSLEPRCAATRNTGWPACSTPPAVRDATRADPRTRRHRLPTGQTAGVRLPPRQAFGRRAV